MLLMDYDKTGLAEPELLLKQLLSLRQDILNNSAAVIQRWTAHIAPERQDFAFSLRNLAHYLVLRRQDMRDLQDQLRPWGVSSLGRIEAQVLPNLDAVIVTLGQILGVSESDLPQRPSYADFQAGRQHLEDETTLLFGAKPPKRTVRIMVTLDSKAAENYEFVRDLLQQGMNLARINCAHDNAFVWAQMIENIRQAEIETGLSCKIAMDLAGPKSRTANVSIPEDTRLKRGDVLLLTGNEPILIRDDIVHLRCTLVEALEQAEVGQRIWFDDGKLGSVITSKIGEGLVLRVTHAPHKGAKLKNDKGINFPDTPLNLSPLTEKDLEDLDFIVQYADIINYSFVQTPQDIQNLQAEIQKRNPSNNLAIVAKIETQIAVSQLPELIASAGSQQAFGVMIARGDLAVEIGFERLAEMQEEILWMCEAAHVPVIWATQVLENLAKKGLPSRAEVTDAAMSERAECVMLNKGEYILDALQILDNILTRMGGHQSKKASRLRALQSW